MIKNIKVNKKLLISILVFGWIVLLLIQWLTPEIWGADGYYHIRLANMIKNKGLLQQLSQAKFSYFANRFSDKDWLYHLLLIPFTLCENIFTGAKWAAWIGGGILYSSIVYISSFYVNEIGLIIVGFSIFLSNHFLHTISRPRPVVLAIALGLWTVHWFLQKKEKMVLSFSLIYSMLHITGFLTIVYGLIIKLWRWIFKEKMNWKTILMAIVGVILGFLIHPNFPNNIFYFYLNGILVPFFAARWGVLELGAEFFPFTTLEYIKSYPLIVFGLLFIVIICLIERPKIKRNTQIMFLLTGMFVVMGMMSRRYIAHGYAFMVLCLGMFVSDWSQNKKFKLFLNKINHAINYLMILGVVIGLVTLWGCFKQVLMSAKSTTIINRHYVKMGEWLKDNVPDGELIFHANWSDPQYFIGVNPKNNYFVTMDPVYMWHRDKEVYKLYRQVSFGNTENPYNVLKNKFKVNYGYIGKQYFSALINQIRKDNRFTIMNEDQLGVIFKLE